MATSDTVIPLSAISAIVLDLETTGLDVRTDRIVQIGAVLMTDGQIDRKNIISINVDPGIEIPELSTRIHGLTAKDLKGKPKTDEALTRLKEVIGELPVIGFNIGFDLAVLENEAKRINMDWDTPPAICLRLLSQCIFGAGRSAIMSDLDDLASYFNINTKARHSASGDALITAEIFVNLIPTLNKDGVRTFAEARHRISTLVSERDSLTQAGWHDIAETSASTTRELVGSRIDSFPFRYRLGELAQCPATIMTESSTLSEVTAAMVKNNTDCIFIGDDPSQIKGIISERDIINAMAAHQKKIGTIQAGAVMASPVEGMGESTLLHVALGRMAHKGIRHLAVLNNYGHLSGWVSARELVHSRGSEAYALGDGILTATNPETLAKATAQLPQLAKAMLGEGVGARDLAGIISQEYLLVTQRAAELAEEKFKKKKQKLPCPWALIVLGSAGRGESLLAADQDHAIVFENPDDKKEIENRRKIFMAFGAEISEILDKARIPLCKGGVMSRNPEWCRSMAEWRSAVAHWVSRASPEDLLNVDIFFDFAVVAGYPEMAEKLEKLSQTPATQSADFLKLLAAKASGYPPSRTLLGGFRTFEGRLDLKMGGLLPIVEMARIIAIAEGTGVRSTRDRINLKASKDNVPVTLARLEKDHEFIISLILRQQLIDLADGIPPGNKIEVKNLSRDESRDLKSALGRVDQIGELMKDILFS
jgi:DNA polymerase-3 subunit epsilon/CBS domain-containing protein